MKKKISGKTIGLLANNYYDIYTYNIWKGAKNAVDEYGGTLICFVGGSLNNPFFNNNQKNAVYDLANLKNVDGLLSISSSIGSYIDMYQLTEFLSSFHPIPMVSIGSAVSTFPSIIINNRTGMEALLRHLIEDHGYRDIAFVRGPSTNQDAEERFATYTDVLTEYKISINPKLIVSGGSAGFHGNFGSIAVSQLLDERKVSFDVLVAANDHVAINALQELDRRGISVPDEVAVVGYDDIPDCLYIKRPLTTVKQPTIQLGYQSAVTMFSLLSGEQIPFRKDLDCSLVIRQTCGCDNTLKESKIANILILKNDSVPNQKDDCNKEIFIQNVVEIMNIEFKTSVDPVLLKKWAGGIYEGIRGAIEGGREKDFIYLLEGYISESFQEQINIFPWTIIIFYIFNTLVYRCKDAAVVQLNCLLQKTLDLLHSMTLHQCEYPIVRANELIILISGFKKMILKVFRASDLEKALCKQFPQFGVKSCYISIYEKEEKTDSHKTARLVIAYKDNKCLSPDEVDVRFSSTKLIPDNIKKMETANSFLVYSLHDKQELLGFVIYTLDNLELQKSIVNTDLNNMCEFLSMEISQAIKSILLYDQVRKQTHSITEFAREDLKSEKNLKYFKYPKEESKEYFRRLLLLMDTEKPYVDEDLSLPQLAEQLNISRNYLSFIINEFSGVNFYDFVNSYRIERAKQYLQKEPKERLNMLKITYDSGFKSKSTFYKTFKKYTNITPTEFRNEFLTAHL